MKNFIILLIIVFLNCNSNRKEDNVKILAECNGQRQGLKIDADQEIPFYECPLESFLYCNELTDEKLKIASCPSVSCVYEYKNYYNIFCDSAPANFFEVIGFQGMVKFIIFKNFKNKKNCNIVFRALCCGIILNFEPDESLIKEIENIEAICNKDYKEEKYFYIDLVNDSENKFMAKVKECAEKSSYKKKCSSGGGRVNSGQNFNYCNGTEWMGDYHCQSYELSNIKHEFVKCPPMDWNEGCGIEHINKDHFVYSYLFEWDEKEKKFFYKLIECNCLVMPEKENIFYCEKDENKGKWKCLKSNGEDKGDIVVDTGWIQNCSFNNPLKDEKTGEIITRPYFPPSYYKEILEEYKKKIEYKKSLCPTSQPK